MNDKYNNAINVLRKYQELVENAFLIQYTQDARGYREKANALDDFNNLTKIVNRVICEYDERQQLQQQKCNMEEIINKYKEPAK